MPYVVRLYVLFVSSWLFLSSGELAQHAELQEMQDVDTCQEHVSLLQSEMLRTSRTDQTSLGVENHFSGTKHTSTAQPLVYLGSLPREKKAAICGCLVMIACFWLWCYVYVSKYAFCCYMLVVSILVCFSFVFFGVSPIRTNFIHIPKCAGASFAVDLEASGIHVKDREMCFGQMYEGPISSTIYMTVLRSPRSHVLSQYMECRYSPWGSEAVKDTNFPQSHEDFYIDFAKWVLFYKINGENGTQGAEGAFNCYNPIDHMARQLSCSRPGMAMAGPHVVLLDVENTSVSLAVENLNKADLVGITELYAETLCLAIFKRTREMPEACYRGRCATPETSQLTHGVPEHSLTNVSQKVINDIDFITNKDQIVYRVGVKRFLRDIEQVEKQIGATILCQERRTALFESTAYVWDNLQERGGI